MLTTILASLYMTVGFPVLAQEDSGPKFGPEFTFSVPGSNYPDIYLQRLLVETANRHLLDGQRAGLRFLSLGYGRYKSPAGWIFDVGLDPGVAEVTMTPMTVGMVETFSSDIQGAIFTSAAAAGMQPALFKGGGHISIDQHYLRARPLLYRNFLADLFVNHVELFLGVLGYDTNNALPQIMSRPEFTQKIKLCFEVYDRCQGPYCIDKLIGDLRSLPTVFLDNYWWFWFSKPKETRPLKHLAVNFTHAHEAEYGQSARLELRAVRPQASIDVWLRQIRLLRNRLRYLQSVNRAIPIKLKFDLQGNFGTDPVNADKALSPPIHASSALENFKMFVEESGEKIEDHLDYVWPAWHFDGSVEAFRGRHNLNSMNCNQLLTEVAETGRG